MAFLPKAVSESRLAQGVVLPVFLPKGRKRPAPTQELEAVHKGHLVQDWSIISYRRAASKYKIMPPFLYLQNLHLKVQRVGSACWLFSLEIEKALSIERNLSVLAGS